jgi:ABC-2 type transport system permease protein
MKTYVSLIHIDLLLAFRNRAVIFFNYLFPFIFFFAFAEMLHADKDPKTMAYVVSMVLVLGILGSGLFGAGMRAVQERESNILRRYKVAPITPVPLLVASMVTGWFIFIPSVIIILALTHFRYGMPFPPHMLSLLIFISLGVITFRAIGLIVASVVNSTQESNILIQLMYMPMLFLSGATFPLESLPLWGQVVSKFLPASYLVSGFRAIFLHGDSLLGVWPSVAALLITLSVSTFVSSKLFRWEKEEKIPGKQKLWVLAALLPFLILGAYQLLRK